MKKTLPFLIAIIMATACANNADKETPGTDTTNSVVLPAGRSSDSLAVPPQTTGDTTGVRKDSAK